MPGNLEAARPARKAAAPVHKVQRGETAAKIARTHGVTLERLADLNPRMNLSKLSVGGRLKVNGSPEPPAARKVRQAAPVEAAQPVPEPAAAVAQAPVSPLPGIPAKKPSALVHLERLIPTPMKILPTPKSLQSLWKSF
jgi:LysM repeat protein